MFLFHTTWNNYASLPIKTLFYPVHHTLSNSTMNHLRFDKIEQKIDDLHLKIYEKLEEVQTKIHEKLEDIHK